MARKVIVNCAVTGAIHVPSMSPYLPLAPEEIAEDAVRAAEAGAATVHIHAREPDSGRPTGDVSVFRMICREIRERCDAVVCMSTGGALTMSVEERMQGVAELQPELASLNTGSMNFCFSQAADGIKKYIYEWEKPYLENSRGQIFKNTFSDQELIFQMMKESGTKPEIECYDAGHLYNVAHWTERRVLATPLWLQFVLGITGGIQASIRNLLFMKETADHLFGDEYVFSVAAAGRHEFPLGTVAVLAGGNVRVGLEDNLYLSKGELARSNADMVAKMVRILRELGLEPATSDEARDILGLKGAAQTSF